MRSICVGFVLLLALITSVQCLQTAENLFYEGNALYDQGKYNEAIKAYDKAIGLDPKLPVAWFNKGNALCMQDKYDEAVKAYDEALRLDPKYAMALNNKGNALNALGKTAEGDAALAKAKEWRETAEDWFDKGNALYGQGKYDEAIKAYDETIGIDPGIPGVWCHKGDALSKQDKYDEAVKAYDEALRLDPKYAMARNNKDIALKKQSKIDENESDDVISKAQTNQAESMVSPDVGVKPPLKDIRVPEKHIYKAGTPGRNQFMLNWTDNKAYSSKMSLEIFDERDDNAYLTNYYVRILNESETSVLLFFVITWHPNIKRPSVSTLENYPSKLDTENILSRSDITIQDEKALMLIYKDKKEYQGSESDPLITPSHYLVRYFLDDYTEIRIEGDLRDWPAQEFKSMLNSLKITPPDGYY